MVEPQGNSSKTDDVIVSHLELLRKSLAENAQVIDNKAWWVFLVTNTASAAVVSGHVYVIQRGNHHFAIGFVFFVFLYLGMLKFFSDIVEPAKYIGGTISWSEDSIKLWMKKSPEEAAKQLISQYQVVCEDMEKRLNNKADKLSLCLRVLNIMFILVGAEASIYIWLGAP